MKTIVRQLLVFVLSVTCLLNAAGQTTSVDFQNFRALHIGGNWALNRDNLTLTNPPVIPEDYFNWLDEVGVNWIGISISMHLDNSLDSTVERNYAASIPTFTDDALRASIRKLRARGLHVYLTLAFETKEAEESEFPFKRYMLGNADIPNQVSTVLPANWPWAIQHPNHASFVNAFFRTYTEQAVHFAALAQEEGVELLSLGTETEGLFRTRSDNNGWPNHFKDQLKFMVDETRKVYSGLLSYDMHYDALSARNYYGVGSDHLWEDLDLDVVGVSAYFPLLSSAPPTPMQLDEANTVWSQIFRDHLIPLQQRNPSKQILFLEFGYTNDMGSPYNPASQEFTNRSFHDVNTNSLEDGEETQGNVYKAFFEVNEANDRTIKGAFLWGNEIMNDLDYSSWNTLVHFGIRQKLAEGVVSEYYGNIRDLPQKPGAPSGPTQLCADPTNVEYSISPVPNATSYLWTVTPSFAGDVSANNTSASINWNNAFIGAAQLTVIGSNSFGEGRHSDSLQVVIQRRAIADFSMTLSGATIVTNNTSSNATSYLWDFDGKASSTELNPTFIVTEPGEIDVTLQASNAACSDTTKKHITIRITGIAQTEHHAVPLIYPNPVRDYLEIVQDDNYGSAIRFIRLTNATGQLLLTENTDRNIVRLDLRSFPAGLYLLSFQDSSDNLTYVKVIKE